MNEEYDYIVNAFTMENENTNLEVNNLSVGCITSKNNNFELDKEGNLTVKSIKTTKYIPLNNEVLDIVYPVGSIYMSVNNVNPKELFGGEWEQITGRFLLGSGSPKQNNYNGLGKIQEEELKWNFQSNTTGGEYSHKLNASEMPSHNHFSGNSSLLAIADIAGTGITGVDMSENGWWHESYKNAVVSQTQGGNQPHNNIPPYLVVNMWKRVS